MSPAIRPSLGQRMGQVAKRVAEASTRFTGGNFDPAIYEQFWPKREVGTWLRLIPGDYPTTDLKEQEAGITDPFYSYVEHNIWTGKKISGSCTERVRTEQPAKNCPVCLGMEGNTNIKRQEKKGFTAVILEHFHKEEIPKKNKPEETYTRLRQCAGRPQVCDQCKQGVPKVFGARRWWSVGGNHFTQLVGLNTTLGGHCVCGGRLERLGFNCPDGHEILKVDSSDKTDQQIETFAQTDVKCPKCEYQGLPMEVLECSKECKAPQRLDIFAVNMKLMTKGSGTDSTVIMEDWENAELPPKFEGDVKPFNLPKILAAPPAALMASRFEVANPFGSGADSGATTAYGGKVTDSSAEKEAAPSTETVDYGGTADSVEEEDD